VRPSAEFREACQRVLVRWGVPRILRLGFYGEMSCFVPINQPVLFETAHGVAARPSPLVVRSARGYRRMVASAYVPQPVTFGVLCRLHRLAAGLPLRAGAHARPVSALAGEWLWALAAFARPAVRSYPARERRNTRSSPVRDHRFACAGGLLFAARYAETNSLFTSSFEHALYGCWLFTIGLDPYFYHGTTDSVGKVRRK
jgi:hypothetical protein